MFVTKDDQTLFLKQAITFYYFRYYCPAQLTIWDVADFEIFVALGDI